MNVELVQIVTADGVRLDGAWQTPKLDIEARGGGIDAFLCLHGTGSNFYGATVLAGMARSLSNAGYGVLRVNTRGHDGMFFAAANGVRRTLGSGYEVVDECRYDIAAWIDFLLERHCTRIVLMGHSLGALKAIYAQAYSPHPAVAGIVAISPPRLSHSHFLSMSRSELFQADFDRARRLFDDGRGHEMIEIRFPVSYAISAAGYIDKYGPEERYNVLRFVDRVECPMFFAYGTQELRPHTAFYGVPEALEALRGGRNNLRCVVIAGADHNYVSGQLELYAHVEKWLRTLTPP